MSEDAAAIDTMPELRKALIAAGHDPNEVGYSDDPQARRDEGSVLLRRLPDGSCDVVVVGRGSPASEQHFDTETEAVAHVAGMMVRPGPTGPAGTPEQRRQTVARMHEVARQVLAELEKQDGRDE